MDNGTRDDILFLVELAELVLSLSEVTDLEQELIPFDYIIEQLIVSGAQIRALLFVMEKICQIGPELYFEFAQVQEEGDF